jgi:ribosomal protein S18 acetylase RimI-like enzyme
MIPYVMVGIMGAHERRGGSTMMTATTRAEAPASSPCLTSRADPDWDLHQALRADRAAVKALFQRLHGFNAALDARFALSDEWETLFDNAFDRALHSGESICLIAREAQSDLPCGFALAAIHRDSDMWRYREWVEVEGLYVDDVWRGRGLAEALLDHICAWAEAIGQPAVQLYVTASNERAIRFYQHEGFSTAQEIMRKLLA